MEKRKFEQEWKDAFDQAEVSPSDNLWTNIELDLEKADASKMKGRLQFYKLMAAASVFFAVCMAGAFAYYYASFTSNGDRHLAATKIQPAPIGREESTIGEHKPVVTERESDNKPSFNQENTVATTKVDETHADNAREGGNPRMDRESTQGDLGLHRERNAFQQTDGNTDRQRESVSRSQLLSGEKLSKNLRANKNRFEENTGYGQKNVPSYNNVVYKPVVTTDAKNGTGSEGTIGTRGKEGTETPIQLTLHERNLPPLTTARTITIQWPEQDPVAVMMARLAQRERELAGEDEKKQRKPKTAVKEERLWTSLGMAAGAFNNVSRATTGVSNNNTFASNNVTANQSNASGTSYSVGMNVGTRLSSRWVLQGGVNYLAQNSSYEANSVVGSADNQSFQAASINAFSTRNANVQANKLVATVPYSVDNSVRFMSVPLQAGYLVINRAVGVQLNGGVSTDLFLQNTLTPQSSSLPTITQNSGEDSPYRTVNFSGLVGTEVSYKFSKHYRLALNPGLRYPLNSIYKSEVGVKSSPLTFDVGLRFRYIFH